MQVGQVSYLQDCTHDTQAFKYFLTGHLHLPNSQIILLMNKVATHNILDAFHKHLTTNTNINEGNAIISYYVGQGSCVMVLVLRIWIFGASASR